MVSFTTLLQSASRPEGPYTTVFGATSPYLWPVSAGPRQYWRSATAGGGTFSAGEQYTVALKSDGSLWAWGWNDSGQLGGIVGLEVYEPVRVSGEGDWISVTCGGAHTVALAADGTLWAWGANASGQLGIGPYDYDLEQHFQPARVGTNVDSAGVACGSDHTVAVKTDGTLWAWGYNKYGQLGKGTYGSTNEPNYWPAQVGTDAGWSAIAAGPSHTAAVKTDGSLWCWGDNREGQLGNGTFDKTNQPVRVGSDADWQTVACGGFQSWISSDILGYTVALKTNGTLWAWGAGQLGNGTFGDTNQPVQIGSDTDWTGVACGGFHTLALKRDGTLWARGDNGSGQLGTGTFASTNRMVRVGSDMDWIRVVAGNSHTVALKANGSLWGWGGRLGSGTGVRTNQPVEIGVDTDWAR
jgi:alpha-tubulin suppressor-like RCC1 family protein